MNPTLMTMLAEAGHAHPVRDRVVVPASGATPGARLAARATTLVRGLRLPAARRHDAPPSTGACCA